jgi:hypothetical protein
VFSITLQKQKQKGLYFKKLPFHLPPFCEGKISMGNCHYRLIFDLDKFIDEKKEIRENNVTKVVTFQNLVQKCCNVRMM